jgi:WD40 repeat protein
MDHTNNINSVSSSNDTTANLIINGNIANAQTSNIALYQEHNNQAQHHQMQEETINTNSSSLTITKKVPPSLMTRHGTQVLLASFVLNNDMVFNTHFVRDEIVVVVNGSYSVVLVNFKKALEDNQDSTNKLFEQNDSTKDSQIFSSLGGGIHSSAIRSSTLSRGEEWLVTGDIDGLIVVWETIHWTVVSQKLFDCRIDALEMNYLSSWLVVGDSSDLKGNVGLLDFVTLEVIDTYQFSQLGRFGTIVCHSSMNRFIVGRGSQNQSGISDNSGYLDVFDVISDKLVNIFHVNTLGWIGSVAFISDTLLVAGGGGSHAALLFDISKKSTEGIIKAFSCGGFIRSLTVSSDVSLLASSNSNDGKIIFWTLPEFNEYRTDKENKNSYVAFSKKLPYFIVINRGLFNESLLKIYMFK